jgi:hypothetical protein
MVALVEGPYIFCAEIHGSVIHVDFIIEYDPRYLIMNLLSVTRCRYE